MPPKSRLGIRIGGLDREIRKRWKRSFYPLAATGWLSPAILLGAVVYLAHAHDLRVHRYIEARVAHETAATPLQARFGVEQARERTANYSGILPLAIGFAHLRMDADRDVRTGRVAGQEFRARKVLLLVDESGSMNKWQAPLAAHLAQLDTAGIEISHRVPMMGGGVGATGANKRELGRNLLFSLESGLKDGPQVDAIYVFSDFEPSSQVEWTDSDAGGYRRLHELVKNAGLRLYVGSVGEPPSGQLTRIATDSRGGVIQAGRAR